MIANTVIRILECKDCTPDLLSKFNRYQEVNHCWRKEDDKWVLKDISYITTWDEKKKCSVVNYFRWCLEHGGRNVGAFNRENLVGFALIDAGLFGSQNHNLLLGFWHIYKVFKNV